MTDTGRCGSREGYRAHRRVPEKACDECNAANTAYARRQRGVGPPAAIPGGTARKIPIEDEYGITRSELERYRGGL